MEDTKKTKDLFYIIVLILTFIIMLIGTTLAYFKFVASQEEDATKLYTGTLEVNFIDGNIVSPLLMPREEPTFDETDFVYRNNFSIESTGTLDQHINVYLDIAENANQFTAGAIKFALYDSNQNKVGEGSIPKSGSVVLLAGNYLASGNTQSYILLLWLQETYINQDIEQGKKLTGTLRVVANQVQYE